MTLVALRTYVVHSECTGQIEGQRCSLHVVGEYNAIV
jgi:hypothetical protein